MKVGSVALGLAASGLWGAMSVLLEEALGLGPLATASLLTAPLAVAAVHDGLASVWVGGVNAKLGRLRSIPAALTSRTGLVVLAAALCGGPLAMGSFVVAIGLIGPAFAATVTATYPAIGAVLAQLLLKERISRAGWIGIMLAVAGAAFASYGSPEGPHSHRLLGTLFACVTALGWGTEGVLIAKAVNRIEPTVALNVYEIISFVTFAAVVLPSVGASGLVADAVTSPAFPVLIAASICGATAYLCYYRSIRILGAARSMTIFNTYILWTLLFAAIASGSWPDWHLATGGVVTMLGIWLLESRLGRAQKLIEQAQT